METVAYSSGCAYILPSPWSLDKLMALLEFRNCGRGDSLAQTAYGCSMAVALKGQPPQSMGSHLWFPAQASASLS